MKATICDIIHLTNVGRATRTPTKSSPPAYDTEGMNQLILCSVASHPNPSAIFIPNYIASQHRIPIKLKSKLLL